MMFSFDGVPALYFNSFFGKSNDETKYVITGNNRDINRYRWNEENILNKLENKKSKESLFFNSIKRLISIRIKQKAFHPNASRFNLNFGSTIFSFKRISLDKKQTIICLYNLTSQLQKIKLSSNYKTWTNLLKPNVKFINKKTIILNPFESMWLSNK